MNRDDNEEEELEKMVKEGLEEPGDQVKSG